MTAKAIVLMGDKRLREPSMPIHEDELRSSEFHALLQDMKDTMDALSATGLAAPQIGVNKRVMMFYINNNPRYPYANNIPFTILINPVIKVLDDLLLDGWEGCLSLPGIRGIVPRYRKIHYTAIDETGKRLENSVEGFHARVIQHETDHLDGKLFIDHLKDTKDLGFESALGDRYKQEIMPK